MTDSDQHESVPIHEQQFDGMPSQAVVTAVAEAADESVLTMPPLAEVIDPDALNGLLGRERDAESGIRVSFPYRGYEVVVTPGHVQLTKDDTSDRP